MKYEILYNSHWKTWGQIFQLEIQNSWFITYENNFLHEICNSLYYSYEILNADLYAGNMNISISHIKAQSLVFK